MDRENIQFVLLTECSNPMEAELLPAMLREREIPHRTEWESGGRLKIFVLAGFADEALAAVEEGRRVFFAGSPVAARPAENKPEQDDREELEQWAFDNHERPVEQMRKRAVWPAQALAVIPGLGLGHLYAGKFQIFIFLVFATFVGFAFWAYSRSPAALVLPLISWATDLGFAAFHVKEHNRRVERLEMRAQAQKTPAEEKDARQP